jgi:FkbM family methyltransferase
VYQVEKKINKQIVYLKAFNDKLLKEKYSLVRRNNKQTISNQQIKISVRCYSSDLNVFQQVFFENEYQDLINVIQEDKIRINTIIDCGANIGLSSVYFHLHYPQAKICAIEPLESNYQLVIENLEMNNINSEVILGAIWNTKTKLGLNFNFRDGKEWSTTTNPLTDEGEIETYTIGELMQIMNFSSIDLLKIDVEGAEKQIFDKTISDLDFLSKTNVIVIEIHDEFNCREMIYKELENYGFEYFEKGELTIAIKKR